MRLLLLALTACAPGTVLLEGAAVDHGTPVGTTDVPVEPPETTETTGPITEPPAPAEDYRLGGPYTVEVRNEEAAVGSCEGGGMAYAVYRPNGIAPIALVVLAHGWVREKAFMAGWAEHWASWGITVVTPDLCHTELWDTDHEANARDLLELQAVIAQGTPVLWAGHSAGGLATLLAAVGDPTALGHLGLDLVDSDALGASVAPIVLVPAALLSGEPGLCNEDGNALPVYGAIPDTDGLRVVGAGHCDFESPTDWGCTTFCDDGSGDAAVQDVIRGLSTAWVLWRSGIA
ncbi:MAG: hypothetical protein H0V89_13320, partial [Deltaproteobacteria bacterium]|nr:hypothetical protein [Deltaproteobacteria bacterium]